MSYDGARLYKAPGRPIDSYAGKGLRRGDGGLSRAPDVVHQGRLALVEIHYIQRLSILFWKQTNRYIVRFLALYK